MSTPQLYGNNKLIVNNQKILSGWRSSTAYLIPSDRYLNSQFLTVSGFSSACPSGSLRSVASCRMGFPQRLNNGTALSLVKASGGVGARTWGVLPLYTQHLGWYLAYHGHTLERWLNFGFRAPGNPQTRQAVFPRRSLYCQKPTKSRCLSKVGMIPVMLADLQKGERLHPALKSVQRPLSNPSVCFGA